MLPIGLLILLQEARKLPATMLAPALTFVFLAPTLLALAPVALKFLIDHLYEQQGGQIVATTLGAAIAIYAALQWLGRVAGVYRSLIVSQLGERLRRTVSDRIIAHIINLPLRYIHARAAGEINQLLSDGMAGIRLVVEQSLATILPVIFQLSTIAIVLLSLSQPIFLLIIGVLVMAYLLVSYVSARKLADPAKEVSKAQVKASTELADDILNFETIKQFGVEPLIQQRLRGAFKNTESRWSAYNRYKAASGFALSSVFGLSMVVTTAIAAHEVQSGGMTVGDFVLIHGYVLQLVGPMEVVGAAAVHTSQGLAFLEGISGFLTKPPEAASQHNRVRGPGELVFEAVSLDDGHGRRILDRVSFRVPAGRTVALVGPSGAGKTCLVRVLLRMWEPDSGRVLLDGIPTTSFSPRDLRHAISVVSQDPLLFNESIAYNIAIGRDTASLSEMEHAARQARAQPANFGKARDYDYVVGERGANLSVGERQRIAIARALLREPVVLVLDEATAALDAITEQEVLQDIRTAFSGKTTLIIAHRLYTIAELDDILVLDSGRLVQRGSHRCLIRRPGIYRRMWQAQQREAIYTSSSTILALISLKLSQAAPPDILVNLVRAATFYVT